jgi:curved DNA-binding protein CbpA
MHLNDDPLSLYDVLELTPDATPQEIRSAYLRLKSAYGKDNIAHYSVFSREETEQMLQAVENAYLILSNPEKRRAYDESQGFRASSHPAHVFGQTSSMVADPFLQSTMGSSLGAPLSSSQLAGLTASLPSSGGMETPMQSVNPTIQSLQSSLDSVMNDIDMVIKNEQTWSGPAIRRIREAKRISLEDLSDYTRISRSYLHALEEENYQKLPATVYVRGFLQQVGRRLKLPIDLLSRQYLDRMRSSAPDKQ